MLKTWINLTMLAAESQQVIGLRMMKAALGGPKAQAEASLMVTEKIAAASHANGPPDDGRNTRQCGDRLPSEGPRQFTPTAEGLSRSGSRPFADPRIR